MNGDNPGDLQGGNPEGFLHRVGHHDGVFTGVDDDFLPLARVEHHVFGTIEHQRIRVAVGLEHQLIQGDSEGRQFVLKGVGAVDPVPISIEINFLPGICLGALDGDLGSHEFAEANERKFKNRRYEEHPNFRFGSKLESFDGR